MAPKASKTPKTQPKLSEQPKEYPTIAAKREAEYLASRTYLVLKDTKGFDKLTANEKTAYTYSLFLETDAWRTWPAPQQKEFWKAVQDLKIPLPLAKPRDLGKDIRGRDLGSYSPEEYRLFEKRQRDLSTLREKSESFKQRVLDLGLEEVDSGDIEEERNRRKLIGSLQGKRMGRYEGDPEWDDVIPIPQEDGEGALAAIAYTDEYAEAMGYLRAIMAAKEHSPRVLALTEHIISLNPAHYTVWLYRASTLLALDAPIAAELDWVNETALENQKNYQIWHHRQILIDDLYSKISSDSDAIDRLARDEKAFMSLMFAEDSKNYHVWSYRQYLVRKLGLFNKAELESIESMLRKDVRNNSAWSHRFFVVFSDPSYSTPGSRATEPDTAIPKDILDREIEFAKTATLLAPQNQSPWNYLRGVLRKGGRNLSELGAFAEGFARIRDGGKVLGVGEEDVTSSHALDFLADVWFEEGEWAFADRALVLLGEKYDIIRKNYWEWRRTLLKEEQAKKAGEGAEVK